MTNNFDNESGNNDEFIEPELGEVEEKARRPGVAGNLAEAWRTRPMFKFMVLLVGVFAVGVAAVNVFGGGKDSVDAAHLGRPPTLKEAPGGAVSPYMRQQTEMANTERSQQAIATGGSAIPTPMGQATDVGFGGNDGKDDPLKELRVETEQLKRQVQQQQVQQVQMQQQVQQRPPETFDNSLSEAMQRQMNQMLESWTPRGMKNVSIYNQEDLKRETAAAKTATAATPAAEGATSSNVSQQPKIVVNAGTVSYAQLLTEANSDVPGPIMAQIVSGPLSGARAIGSFQVAMGYEKYLVLTFTLADKKGKDYTINAIALDPDTTLGGMATEVDERYFTRVVLPAAAGFLQGMGQTLGQGASSVTTSWTTTITTQATNGYKQGIYNGLGQAAQTMGQFFQDQANLTKPLVRIASGTPIGIFFVSSVYEPTANGAGNGNVQPNGYYNNANGYNNSYGTNGYNGAYGANGYNTNGYGYNTTGYPGTTVTGYGSSTAQNSGSVPYPNYATMGSNRGTTTYGSTQYSPY